MAYDAELPLSTTVDQNLLSALKVARKAVVGGWTQGRSVRLNTAPGAHYSYCTLGAINRGRSEFALNFDRSKFWATMVPLFYDELLQTKRVKSLENDEVLFDIGLSDRVSEMSKLIADWNDHPLRSQAEVVMVFDHVIERIENGV